MGSKQPTRPFDDLVQLVARLRAPQGCDWDRAQSPRSLAPYVLEEAHELVAAIDADDLDGQREELGDLLFLVTMLAQVAAESGQFSIDDVAATISAKMRSRHPHIFGDLPAGDLPSWEERKRAERGDQASALDGVPRALPALLRAQRVGERAAAVGFDWPDIRGPRAKLSEEVEELDAAALGDEEGAVHEELGDVLFSVVNLARHLGLDAESALRDATAKFEDRFRRLEADVRAVGGDPASMDATDLEGRWQQIKEPR